MPPGFTGDLRGITYCPEAAIAAAAAEPRAAPSRRPRAARPPRQIGTTNVAAGPGSPPVPRGRQDVPGGAVQGRAARLVAITPALAGPYDYGVVVVRVALHVDPLTPRSRAVSDTVPSIIGGIPIRMRSIQVNIDKPELHDQPDQLLALLGRLAGDRRPGHGHRLLLLLPRGQLRHAAVQAEDDGPPARRPQGARSAAANPQLQFDLSTRPGDANIKSLSVTLSNAFEIDQRHLGNICSRERARRETVRRPHSRSARRRRRRRCSTSRSTGPVYAVSGSGGLPHLAFILDGQVKLIPRAETSTDAQDGRLQTTVPVVPDAPIGHFHLTVFGGKTGYLVNTRDLCAHRPVTAGRLHRPERQAPGRSRSRPPAAARPARPRSHTADRAALTRHSVVRDPETLAERALGVTLDKPLILCALIL